MAGGSEQQLLEDYFDAMLEMVNELKPAVVGHFDLIRLFSREKERELKSYGEGVWGRVEMCLRAIQSYGGLLEVNSAAVRKGWATPYPGPEVAEVSLCPTYSRFVRAKAD